MFSHPLARAAKVWPSVAYAGQTQNVLVVVTTLELDSQKPRFKKDKVHRLKEAVQEWLSFNQNEAGGFVLINRVKDW